MAPPAYTKRFFGRAVDAGSFVDTLPVPVDYRWVVKQATVLIIAGASVAVAVSVPGVSFVYYSPAAAAPHYATQPLHFVMEAGEFLRVECTAAVGTAFLELSGWELSTL